MIVVFLAFCGVLAALCETEHHHQAVAVDEKTIEEWAQAIDKAVESVMEK